MNEEWMYNQKVAGIGIFGGVLWSLIGYAAYLLNFTEMGPAMAVQPWALPQWKETYLGHFAGIAVIALLSVFTAFLYRILFQKWESIWLSAAYGLVLWVVVFYFLHPLFPDKDPITSMDLTDLVTTICLYVMYGVFIGYSVSYEYKIIQHHQA
ncbi:YqhR family membrane protein [Salibacterium halotolerans]|uniref:Conserved membrane protein YqhR n=1 Tax=Salibacterium halotolerans TaxID=1884432 RepID=A0A1I5NMB6_9BACI|nr:YqhR family membrane protein [Salibacterium halotolerans]SFP22978.1 Conserved membrane protein YqhR [Salibacterium halotolerans]